jgi:hypothetical protein
MFYAFNLDFAAHYDLGTGYRLVNAMRGGIVAYGQYPVLFLLIFELALLGKRAIF